MNTEKMVAMTSTVRGQPTTFEACTYTWKLAGWGPRYGNGVRNRGSAPCAGKKCKCSRT